MRIWGLSFLREFLFNACCASNHLDLAIFNPICSATVTSFHSFDSLAVHWDRRLLRFFRTSRGRRVWGYILTRQFGEFFCLSSACVFGNVDFFYEISVVMGWAMLSGAEHACQQLWISELLLFYDHICSLTCIFTINSGIFSIKVHIYKDFKFSYFYFRFVFVHFWNMSFLYYMKLDFSSN